jgi:hypothetical protein
MGDRGQCRAVGVKRVASGGWAFQEAKGSFEGQRRFTGAGSESSAALRRLPVANRIQVRPSARPRPPGATTGMPRPPHSLYFDGVASTCAGARP